MHLVILNINLWYYLDYNLDDTKYLWSSVLSGVCCTLQVISDHCSDIHRGFSWLSERPLNYITIERGQVITRKCIRGKTNSDNLSSDIQQKRRSFEDGIP